MSTLEFPTPSLVDSGLLEPPVLPFKLLHLERAPEWDHQDKRAFNVWVELVGLVEMGSPCLYFMAPQDERCAFAIAQHAPITHINHLMMMVVDQDSAYEALGLFEERVRARARRLLVEAVPLEAVPSLREPPSWVLAPSLDGYDPANEVVDYGDLD